MSTAGRAGIVALLLTLGVALVGACSSSTLAANCCVDRKAYDCKTPLEQQTCGKPTMVCARDEKRDPDCD